MEWGEGVGQGGGGPGRSKRSGRGGERRPLSSRSGPRGLTSASEPCTGGVAKNLMGARLYRPSLQAGQRDGSAGQRSFLRWAWRFLESRVPFAK